MRPDGAGSSGGAGSPAPDETAAAAASGVLHGAGALRADYAAVDWDASPVGPPGGWSTALRTAASLAFSTSFPVTLLWGPEHVLLYNEAYAALFPAKHPEALGRPCQEVFPEIWDEIGPLMRGVMSGGGAVHMVDQELHLVRRGFTEESYFTYAYSPVTGDGGVVEGVLDLVVETTASVVDARRARLLGQLAELPTRLHDPLGLAALALPVLRTATKDLPLVELVVPGEPERPRDLRLSGPPPEAADSDLVVVDGPAGRTAWLRVPGAGAASSRPLLAVLLSTGLAEDDVYLGFLRQVAAALGNAVAVATAIQAAAARAELRAAQVRRLVGLVRTLQELPGAEEPEALERVTATAASRLLGATGARLVLADGAAEAAATTARGAGIPLQVSHRHLGHLHVDWAPGRALQHLSEEERAVLSVLTSSTAQALDRSSARRAEREATAAVRAIAEELQRSLLTAPPAVDGLEIAVRYSPAAEHAQVGGDWYDAFTTPTGALHLVIGDVTGHDQRAAAAMGQLRNTLRGVAHGGRSTPARVLGELDAALPHLGVTSLATAVLGTLSGADDDGARQLVWSSAGHLPPLLVGAGGPPRLLEEPAELLLGLFPGTPRTDHTTAMPRGATVLLYTDGLVERRGSDLQAGLSWLLEATAALEGAGPEELCDALLEMVGGRVDDDIALVAVRVV
ncbi:PP2C family protein-serine/threonine phosphatase [Quadrisphaera sp. INWT6]|uniref:PP2C family protein-serine/threonine phosphatase n=1 Tax=Quadrisphaera sp. INWT6 TaxID=2596917 RepID=UPI0018924B0F|nr:PP2C family protein-serine/threonine phosphatase [Quadrisphaera sp. INWT6]MBF5082260.1 serine/threonine-protein phosphatase [Quadrisphaera sp. INWT6]